MVVDGLYRFPLVLPNLRDKFPLRRDDPAVTRFHSCRGGIGRQRQIGGLKNELNLFETPLLAAEAKECSGMPSCPPPYENKRLKIGEIRTDFSLKSVTNEP